MLLEAGIDLNLNGPGVGPPLYLAIPDRDDERIERAGGAPALDQQSPEVDGPLRCQRSGPVTPREDTKASRNADGQR